MLLRKITDRTDDRTDTEKTKYMLSRHQHAEQNRNVKTANMSFKIGIKLEYLGKII
jgi:hypothetical protein